MSEMTEFKRMNYFTGFFTTADDWKAEQEYHRQKLKFHNRGLHTPGILRGIADELNVLADEQGNLIVQPGAAIDSEGNEIYLGISKTVPVPALSEPETVYVTLAYDEAETDPVTNVQMPEYSGNTRVTEKAVLTVSTLLPDHLKNLELARISLPANSSKVANPVDPSVPGVGEIDRRYAVFAGSIGIADAVNLIDPLLQGRVELLMAETRKAFAALSSRFPAPSAADVRQAALTVQMLACAGSVRGERLVGLMGILADTEQDAGQEIGTIHAGLAKFREYQDYVDAVDALRIDLRTVPDQRDKWLTSQGKVALAARELAEIVLALPEAAAGDGQTILTTGNEAAVILDGSTSRAFGGRTVSTYLWDLKSSAVPPQANPGTSQLIEIEGTENEATVTLDASSSKASEGLHIEKYIWNKVIIPL